MNREREKRAEQYLLRCDEVFVVAPILRVVSNLSVDRFIREYSKRRSTVAQSRNIVVICTHAEVRTPMVAPQLDMMVLMNAGN